MEFTTDTIFEALKGPLGVIDNEERRRQIEAYIEAARPTLERAVFDLLSRFAEAVNAEVGAHYQVALAYRPGVLDLDVRATEAGEGGEATFSFAEGDVEKITIRIPAELKDLATEAAMKANVSANSWVVRALARALRGMEPPEPPPPPPGPRRHHPHGHPGQRLSGWVGPEGER